MKEIRSPLFPMYVGLNKAYGDLLLGCHQILQIMSSSAFEGVVLPWQNKTEGRCFCTGL